MKTPLVSILLPSFREAPHIEKAIISIIKQSFANWELVIIDDGLNPDSLKIVLQYKNQDSRVVYVKNKKNLGIQKSLNIGIKNSKGEYLARIDDDDEWIDSNKLSEQVTFLEKNPDHVLVGTKAIIMNEENKNFGVYELPQSDAMIRKRILSKNCFVHSSILVSKNVVEKVGGYDEISKVAHIEDYALWLKLGLLGKFANLNIVGVKLTIHPGSLTFKNRVAQAKNMLNLAKDYSKKYPNFIIANIMLRLRILGFCLIKLIPIPEKALYRVQKIYKDY